MKNKILFILTTVFLFYSCKKLKRNCIDADITVREAVSGVPIANAMVVIKKGPPSAFTGTTPVETLYTDYSGKVHYELKDREEDYMYYAFAYHDDYIFTSEPYGLNALKHQDVVMTYYAKGYVKLHIKNVNPFNSSDLFRLSQSCRSWDFIGNNIDTIILFCDYGNAFMSYFNYETGGILTRNGIKSEVHFKFTPIPKDTVLTEVFY